MSSTWDDAEHVELEGAEDEDDVGLVGGGGPPATMDEDDTDELDRHGGNLREVDEHDVDRGS
ncbi:MAG: hypothetical protein ICV64_06210 [Thermoleophilia bacterium]|nr:hypothetical protein [Thermoleophilia bacterium]